MRISAFQTGARYTADGQRIAWAVLINEMGGTYLVGFYDVDRHVYNVVRLKGEPSNDKVMQEYLNCRYIREFYLPGPVEDALKAAALTAPSLLDPPRT